MSRAAVTAAVLAGALVVPASSALAGQPLPVGGKGDANGSCALAVTPGSGLAKSKAGRTVRTNLNAGRANAVAKNPNVECAPAAPVVTAPVVTPPVVDEPPVVTAPVVTPPVVDAPPVVTAPVVTPPVVDEPPVVTAPVVTPPVVDEPPVVTAPIFPPAVFTPPWDDEEPVVVEADLDL
jgi:hypothetical protein